MTGPVQDHDQSDPQSLRRAIARGRRQLGAAAVRSVDSAARQLLEWKDDIRHLAETEIKPLQTGIRENWQVIRELASEDEGPIADAVHEALDFIRDAGFRLSRTGAESGPGPNSFSTPRLVWHLLTRAPGKVAETEGRESSARAQTVSADIAICRCLNVSALAVAICVAGILFWSPLRPVSAGLLLYASLPVLKSAVMDLFIRRRITTGLLESISLVGLLAGGYILLCGITCCVLLTCIKLLMRTEDRVRQSIEDSFGAPPDTVRVLSDREHKEIPFSELLPGDTLLLRSRQAVPADGWVVAGNASVDQSALTGGSRPTGKNPGDPVFAATTVISGLIQVRVQETGEATAAAHVRALLTGNAPSRAAIQSRWQDAADRTVLPTLGLAGIALAIFNPLRALAVVNSNCFALLKVSSPLRALRFVERAWRAGILICDNRSAAAVAAADTVIFDRTALVSEAWPRIGRICLFDETPADELLACAAAALAAEKHPVARAVQLAAQSRNLILPILEDARSERGMSVEARIGGRLVLVGDAGYMRTRRIGIPDAIGARQDSFIYVATPDGLAGAIELTGTLRVEAKEIAENLKRRGLNLCLVSGEDETCVAAMAAEVGIDRYFAGIAPERMASTIGILQNEGRRLCFVSESIDGAIGLRDCDIAISLQGPHSLALNGAQVVLMDESLGSLDTLFALSRDYGSSLRTVAAIPLITGLTSLIGIFFFSAGNAWALVLANLGVIAGTIAGVWPSLRAASPGYESGKNS